MVAKLIMGASSDRYHFDNGRGAKIIPHGV